MLAGSRGLDGPSEGWASAFPLSFNGKSRRPVLIWTTVFSLRVRSNAMGRCSFRDDMIPYWYHGYSG